MTGREHDETPKALPIIRPVICYCADKHGRHGCDVTADAVLVALHAAGWTLAEPTSDAAAPRCSCVCPLCRVDRHLTCPNGCFGGAS